MTTDGSTIARAFKRIIRRKAHPALIDTPTIVKVKKLEPRQPATDPATEARAFFARMIRPPDLDE
jgi:hypothetical protein